jgi:DNA-binding PucR family transcriptional regulator
MPQPPKKRLLRPRDSTSVTEARTVLRHRLEDRRAEAETALASRLSALSSPTESERRGRLQQNHRIVSAALDYALIIIAQGEQSAPDIPLDLLIQARVAARRSVPLETVLRRCFAGYSVLAEWILREAQSDDPLRPAALSQILRGQAASFDRLIEAMTGEYRQETGRRRSREERFRERIQRLLAGETLDNSTIDYDFNGHHIGGIGRGKGARAAASALAREADRRLLLVQGEQTVWAWFGGSVELTVSTLAHLASTTFPPETRFTFGESASGLRGWRLTHLQAQAALTIAERTEAAITRYGDVGLLASVLSDRPLTESLRDNYLRPLESERDGGVAARDTLNAYFSVDRNVSSAAALLGVKRHTVTRRLRAIEQLLGRTLTSCAMEMELALQLESIAPNLKPMQLSRQS